MNQIYGMSEYKRISFAFVLIVVLRSRVTRLNKIARYFDWTCFGLKEDIKHHEAYYIFLSYIPSFRKLMFLRCSIMIRTDIDSEPACSIRT